MNSSKKVGLGPQEWKALKAGDISQCSEAEQTAIRYAEKVTRTPGQIGEADIQKLKTHFTDKQIADLHLLIGMINMGNRFTGPLALDLEIPPIQL
jgi:alkylhydroperoxidase family enzyme